MLNIKAVQNPWSPGEGRGRPHGHWGNSPPKQAHGSNHFPQSDGTPEWCPIASSGLQSAQATALATDPAAKFSVKYPPRSGRDLEGRSFGGKRGAEARGEGGRADLDLGGAQGGPGGELHPVEERQAAARQRGEPHEVEVPPLPQRPDALPDMPQSRGDRRANLCAPQRGRPR